MHCRWLLPLAKLLGSTTQAQNGATVFSGGNQQAFREVQGSPSLRGVDESQLPTQAMDHQQADDPHQVRAVCHPVWVS